MEYISIVISSVCSIIIGYCAYKLEKHDKERDNREQMKEKDREDFELYMIQSSQATLKLAKATAKAVQRIPDAKCNGDMHKALEDADKAKAEQMAYLHKKAIEKII
jgi:hypothetical protein